MYTKMLFMNVLEKIKKMQKDSGVTNIIISHQERILNIADEVIIMNQGKIEKIGNKEDVLEEAILDKGCFRRKELDNE